MNDLAKRFCIEGSLVGCEKHGCGHINRTFLVTTDAGRRYLLQSINMRVFPDVAALMDNIARVTRYIAARSETPERCLTIIPTRDGADYLTDAQGACWRMFAFLENSLCLQTAETNADFYESGVGFGAFQCVLADFPAHTLHETIADFHNTPVRYAQLHAAAKADPLGRLASVSREMDYALSQEASAGVLQQMRDDGTLPLRVTHNDTKLNNVMFDAATRKAMCVIDLDTVMPGLVAYDFGDAIRFGASTAVEDERELDKVGLDMKLYEAFARGFLSACPPMSAAEIDSLAEGARLMTLENGIRFLADYLLGDVYYSIDRPEHNLDRARTQFKLLAEMNARMDEMRAVVRAAASV